MNLLCTYEYSAEYLSSFGRGDVFTAIIPECAAKGTHRNKVCWMVESSPREGVQGKRILRAEWVVPWFIHHPDC